METVTSWETDSNRNKRSGVLYPVMLVAAIAVIAFSVAGIATMMGWLPSAQSRGDGIEKTPPAKAAASHPRAFASASGTCSACGVVESIRAVEVQGEGTGLGAIGGAVVGGILGNQVGRGSGRTAAAVVGAGAGAYAGHEIEKNVKKSIRYEVRVRMSDGTLRTFHERVQPALSVGQKVRVTDQGVVALG